jgi:uncharacterized membrane protein (Fun14 family)
MNRTALRKPAVERRPVVRNVVQRSAAAVATPSPARALQDRVGNRAVQAVVAPSIQMAAAARVSKPTDAAEMEAEAIARHVARMSQPVPAAAAGPRQVSKSEVQREAAAPPRKTAPSSVGGSGGSPLPLPVRDFMEPRFGANFEHVRVHTGDDAAHQSAHLGANAFTYGNNVFFGKDKFQPQTAKGKELIAHELTHTIQQGAAGQKGTVHRSAMVSASEAPMVQRDFLGIPNPREYFANKAENIPGFTMLTVVIGYNPITNARVARSAGNILKGAIQMIPGGKLISDALDSHGIFDQVSQWVNQQFEALKDIGAAIWQSIENFIKGFKLSDLADLGGLWERAKALVTAPIERIKNFAIGVKDGIVKLIKDAILKPVAAYAATTRGYPLLRTIMGKDPITGETVAQDAESLLGAFLTFIGEDELWATMQKAKAVPRAFAWFKAAKAALMGFIAEIPGLFVQAFRSLEVSDIILIPRAFVKLAHVFGGFAARFVSWGATAVWNLLEIIFDVVSPGALAYIKKTGAALKSILKNPLPFMGNLIKAATLGLSNFVNNFVEHLKASLIEWLTGSLPGVYIPKSFDLKEIAKFAMSVLGLTWENMRQKLVKQLGEPVVKAMETGFDIVVTLVRDGPAAAWDKIKEQLANLKDMVIGGITDFILGMVVKKAIPKLISMFIPGAGFISAILSIYDTIMVIVDKVKQIVALVKGFVDSIVAIAGGNISAAADRVEKSLAGGMSLAISFLAGFVGLGRVSDAVKGVFAKMRAPFDKAMDWLAAWIGKAGQAFLKAGKAVVGSVVGAGKAAIGAVKRWAGFGGSFKDPQGQTHTLSIDEKGMITVRSTPQAARQFVELYLEKLKGDTLTEAKKVQAKMNPLLSQAEAVVAEIQKSTPKDDETPAPAQQKKLLDLSNQISALLGELVNGKRDVSKEQKYLLEGQVGTYATVPKPIGDKLTPDHQPQASVVQAAADFFGEQFGLTGTDLQKRALNRANQGYAINLHFDRHVAGSTYGSKGKTREGFKKELQSKAGSLPVDKARAEVSSLLKEEMKKDVAQMKKVAKQAVTDKPWARLKDDIAPENLQKTKDEIAERIEKGEDQIASQPLDF